jgi:hypothetical protein
MICVPFPASCPITAIERLRRLSGSTCRRFCSSTEASAEIRVASARCAGVLATARATGAGPSSRPTRIIAIKMRRVASSMRAWGTFPAATAALSPDGLPIWKLSTPAFAPAAVSRTARIASGSTNPRRPHPLRMPRVDGFSHDWTPLMRL